MTDLTNPNAERFRKTPSDESVEGCLGASSAGQGEVTPSALTTTPPLDLAAIKKRLDSIPPKGESAMAGMAFPVSAATELWNLRHIAREDVPALIARAEAAEANHQKAERKANDLFDEGIRQKNRAIAAEKKVKAARKLVDTCSLYGMVPCDDLDKALDGTA